MMLFKRFDGYNVVRISPLAELHSVEFPNGSAGFDKNGNYLYATVYQVGNHRMEIYDISDVTSWSLTGTAN